MSSFAPYESLLPTLTEAQAEALGEFHAHHRTRQALEGMNLVEPGADRLTEGGRHLAVALLAFHCLVALIERYVARHGRDHAIGDDGFEGRMLAWFQDVCDKRYAVPALEGTSLLHQYLCLCVIESRRVCSRLDVERLIQQRLDARHRAAP